MAPVLSPLLPHCAEFNRNVGISTRFTKRGGYLANPAGRTQRQIHHGKEGCVPCKPTKSHMQHENIRPKRIAVRRAFSTEETELRGVPMFGITGSQHSSSLRLYSFAPHCQGIHQTCHKSTAMPLRARRSRESERRSRKSTCFTCTRSKLICILLARKYGSDVTLHSPHADRLAIK